MQALCLDSLEPPIVDLALSAIKSVRKWKFTPARIDDTPTAAAGGRGLSRELGLPETPVRNR